MDPSERKMQLEPIMEHHEGASDKSNSASASLMGSHPSSLDKIGAQGAHSRSAPHIAEGPGSTHHHSGLSMDGSQSGTIDFPLQPPAPGEQSAFNTGLDSTSSSRSFGEAALPLPPPAGALAFGRALNRTPHHQPPQQPPHQPPPQQPLPQSTAAVPPPQRPAEQPSLTGPATSDQPLSPHQPPPPPPATAPPRAVELPTIAGISASPAQNASPKSPHEAALDGPPPRTASPPGAAPPAAQALPTPLPPSDAQHAQHTQHAHLPTIQENVAEGTPPSMTPSTSSAGPFHQANTSAPTIPARSPAPTPVPTLPTPAPPPQSAEPTPHRLSISNTLDSAPAQPQPPPMARVDSTGAGASTGAGTGPWGPSPGASRTPSMFMQPQQSVSPPSGVVSWAPDVMTRSQRSSESQTAALPPLAPSAQRRLSGTQAPAFGQPPPAFGQPPLGTQQGWVPVSVLNALLGHPAFSSAVANAPDVGNIIAAAAAAGQQATQPLPIPPNQLPQQQQVPMLGAQSSSPPLGPVGSGNSSTQPQQQPRYSQQFYAQQAWVAQQQAQAFANAQAQAQQAAAAERRASERMGMQPRLPQHLRNVAAHHSERAAQILQQPNVHSPSSAVMSYMDQLSEVGDDGNALPVGEPLATNLQATSSYAPSEQMDTSADQDTGQTSMQSGRLSATLYPGRAGGGDVGLRARLHGDRRARDAGKVAEFIASRVGNMARPPTLNQLHQAAEQDEGNEGGDAESDAPSPSDAPPRSEGFQVRGAGNAGQSSRSISQAPSQAGGPPKPMSVAAMFGAMASDQMALLRKNGCSAAGGVPPDEDEQLQRRKAKERMRAKMRKQELERERLGLPQKSTLDSGIITPSHVGSDAPELPEKISYMGEPEPSRMRTTSHLQSRRQSNVNFALPDRSKSIFVRDTTNTNVSACRPSISPALMGSVDGAKSGNERTAFMDENSVSALTQAIRNGDTGTPAAGSTAPEQNLSRLASAQQPLPPPVLSKVTTRRPSHAVGIGGEAQVGSVGGERESLGQQYTIKIDKRAGMAEMKMDNAGPDWLKKAAASTPSDEQSVHEEPSPAQDPLLAEGEPLLNEDGEPLDEEEAKRRRDEELKKPGAAQEQLGNIGLFVNPDDDDDDMKKHDLQRALDRKNIPWYMDKWWQLFIFLHVIAILLMVIGIVLQEKVRRDEGIDTEAFRWFYFFCFCPPFWYAVDLSVHYIFYMVEWRFFANTLLYLKNLVRHIVVFLFLTLLLIWHAVCFRWAWCHEDGRCEGDDFLRAENILWRVHICCVLFALAQLFKATFAKMLSTHFYKTAHFRKLESALEKEYFLQMLSKPQRKIKESKQQAAEAERVKQEAQMIKNASHEAHLFRMNQVADKVREVKKNIQHGTRASMDMPHEKRKSHSPDGDPSQPKHQKNKGSWGFNWGQKHAHHPTHRRASSADNPAQAKAVTQDGQALPLTMESLKLLQAMNENPQHPGFGGAFPVGAKHVVGGGADGSPYVRPGQGSAAQQDMQDAGGEPTLVRPSTSAPASLDLLGEPLDDPFISHPNAHINLGSRSGSLNPPPGNSRLQHSTLPDPPDPPPPPMPAPPPPPGDDSRHSNPARAPGVQLSHTNSSQDSPGSGGPSNWRPERFPSRRTTRTSSPPGGSQEPPPPPPLSSTRGNSLERYPNTLQHRGSARTTNPQDVAINVDAAPDEIGLEPYRVYAGHGYTYNPAFEGDTDQGRPEQGDVHNGPKPLPAIAELHKEGHEMHGMSSAANIVSNGPSRRQTSRLGDSAQGGGDPPDKPARQHSKPGGISGWFSRLQSKRLTSSPGNDGSPPLERASQMSRASQKQAEKTPIVSPLDEAVLDGIAPLPGKLKDEPAKLKKKKDLAQLTEDELEKMRTAVVVKTYTAIIRNYNKMSVEEQEEEMARVRAFSRALFYNIKGDEDREYVSLEDFELFFNDRKTAAKAFACFDVDGDNHVTRREIKDGVVAIYKQRANMAASLKDTDSIVQSLETAIGGVIHFIFVAFYLLIWNVSLVEGFSTFSATLLAFTFIFGNAVRNMFEAMLFLFIEHAYDVGDNILMNGEIHRIKKITLLYTEMITLNGERIFYPNTGLVNAVIRNWTRTKTFTEFIFLQVDVGMTPFILHDTMASMLEHAKACPTEYDDVPFLQFFSLADPMKVTLLLTFTYAFNPDEWTRLVPARNAMIGIAQAKFAEHRVRSSVLHVERRTLYENHEPLPTSGQPLY